MVNPPSLYFSLGGFKHCKCWNQWNLGEESRFISSVHLLWGIYAIKIVVVPSVLHWILFMQAVVLPYDALSNKYLIQCTFKVKNNYMRHHVSQGCVKINMPGVALFSTCPNKNRECGRHCVLNLGLFFTALGVHFDLFTTADVLF